MKKHLRIATALLVPILAISLTGCENYQAERHQSEEEVIGVVSEKNYTEEEIFSSHKVDKLLNMKRNIFYIIR